MMVMKIYGGILSHDYCYRGETFAFDRIKRLLLCEDQNHVSAIVFHFLINSKLSPAGGKD